MNNTDKLLLIRQYADALISSSYTAKSQGIGEDILLILDNRKMPISVVREKLRLCKAGNGHWLANCVSTCFNQG